MSYHGDIALESTIDIKFTSRRFSSGAPFTLAGTPAIAAYVGNSTTEITAGITLTVDFDTRTGLNNVRVAATAANGYTAGTNVQLVITAGTVDSVSVVGEVVGSFSIENRSGLRPTVSGRTLDVSSTGEAGLDWANIGSPTTAQNLSATNIDVDQVVASVSGAVASVTAAVTVGTINANVITAASMAADAGTEIAAAVWNEDATGHQTQGTFGQAIGDPGADSDTIWAIVNAIGSTGTGLTAIPWNASWDAEVQSEVEDAIVVHRLDELLNADSDIDGVAPPTVGSVFHELMSKTAGSFTFDQTTDSNEAIRDRGDAAWITATGFSTHSAADIWAVATRALTVLDEDSTTLDLDATIRAAIGLAAANLDTQLSTIDDFLDTEITAIKGKTDQLTFTVANQVDATAVTVSTGAIGTGDISSAALNEIADAVLDRNMTTGTDSGSPTVRTVRQALRASRNRVNIAAGTATIYKEDDTTASWTATITTTAGNPISQVDPA